MAQGLYLPGYGPGSNFLGLVRLPGVSDKWVQRTGAYAFDSFPWIPALPACVAVVPTNPALVKACAIGPVVGDLTPVAGIGAACGFTHGREGVGALAIGGVGYVLDTVGWILGAGNPHPVRWKLRIRGDLRSGQDKGPLNGKRVGPVVGVLVAQGGAPCLKTVVTGKAGASTFNILGVAALL